jgi:hypothetical protein
MLKPINLTISFRLPKNRKVAKASIQPDGEIVLTDDRGNPVTPEHMERTVQYSRSKGPKIQSRSKVTCDRVSVGGLKEFTQYESVFVIDTNTRTVNGEKISVACFVCCRFVSEAAQVRIDCEGKLNIYEFHNVPEKENPEMLAVLKVARDVARSSGSRSELRIAFVSDSELGSHDGISSRQQLIYGDSYLPPGFVLHYASTDTGQEAINRLIKFCDKKSSNYLSYLEEGSVKKSELNPLEEEPSVLYRYMFRDDLEMVNPIVRGISIQPGTTVTLYGVRGAT